MTYSAEYGTIKTGFQASGPSTIFTDGFEQLLTIFQWGTPLVESVQPLHLEVEPVLLNRMASVFAPSPTTQAIVLNFSG